MEENQSFEGISIDAKETSILDDGFSIAEDQNFIYIRLFTPNVSSIISFDVNTTDIHPACVKAIQGFHLNKKFKDFHFMKSVQSHLQQGEYRPAICCEIQIDKNHSLKNPIMHSLKSLKIYECSFKNKRRFTYDQIDTFLEKQHPHAIDIQNSFVISWMFKIAKSFYSYRESNVFWNIVTKRNKHNLVNYSMEKQTGRWMIRELLLFFNVALSNSATLWKVPLCLKEYFNAKDMQEEIFYSNDLVPLFPYYGNMNAPLRRISDFLNQVNIYLWILEKPFLSKKDILKLSSSKTFL